MPASTIATVLMCAALLCFVGVEATVELRVGPAAALANPALLRFPNDTQTDPRGVTLDLNAEDAERRTMVLVVSGDTFRTAAPNQFSTAALVLVPVDARAFIRPYGLQAALTQVPTAASPDSFHSRSAVRFVNTTAALVTFARVPWFDGHRGETAAFAVDGSLFARGRTAGRGTLLTFEGPGRDQSILWAAIWSVLLVAHAIFDPHGVVDCQLAILLVALPCCHSVPARIGDALWRLLSPLAFAAEPTPEAVVGSSLVVAVIAAAGVVFAVLHRGAFAEAPVYFSRWWFSVIAFLALPSNVASWQMLTRGESPALGFFGFLGLVFFSAGPVALVGYWVYANRGAARFRRYSWHPRQELHWRLLYPVGFWVDAFTETSLTLVRDADRNALVAVGGSTAKAVTLAAVLGTSPNNAGDCAAVYLLVAIACALQLVSDAALRWRRSVARNAADALVSFGLLLMAIGGSTQAELATGTEPQTMYAGVGITALSLAARAVHAVWIGVLERGWIDKQVLEAGEETVPAQQRG